MDSIKHMILLACAGVSGAIIGLSIHPSERTPFQRFMFILSGLLVAFWLTPFICRYFGLTAPEEISAVAFAAGAFWSSIVDKVGHFVKNISILTRGNKGDKE